MSDTWIILGATSSLAKAFTRLVAEEGAGLILCARDLDDAEATAADSRARGATSAEALAIDVRDAKTFGPILERGSQAEGALNIAAFVGSMPDQTEIDADPSMVEGVITDSFTGPAEFLTRAIPELERREEGTVVGVSSVAGDRGRLGNYVYGAAKAGFTTYLSGLRNRLGRSGVHVVTVKPGPIDTAMTWSLGKQPMPTTAEAAAADILRAAKRKKNVLYTKGPWRIIMTIIRAIPEPIFKKMKI